MGMPGTVVSDNGPQFSSSNFAHFIKKHAPSSPHHSRSNGKVESSVKSAMKMIRKAKKCREALLNIRNTPTQGIDISFAHRLLRRRTKTILPRSLLESWSSVTTTTRNGSTEDDPNTTSTLLWQACVWSPYIARGRHGEDETVQARRKVVEGGKYCSTTGWQIVRSWGHWWNSVQAQQSSIIWRRWHNIAPNHTPAGVSAAPLTILHLIKCGCSTSRPCSTGRCGCVAAQMSCSMLCCCYAGSDCCNEHTRTVAANPVADEEDDVWKTMRRNGPIWRINHKSS